MAQRIIESVDMEKAPLRMVLGSQALSATIERLKRKNCILRNTNGACRFNRYKRRVVKH